MIVCRCRLWLGVGCELMMRSLIKNNRANFCRLLEEVGKRESGRTK